MHRTKAEVMNPELLNGKPTIFVMNYPYAGSELIVSKAIESHREEATIPFIREDVNEVKSQKVKEKLLNLYKNANYIITRRDLPKDSTGDNLEAVIKAVTKRLEVGKDVLVTKSSRIDFVNNTENLPKPIEFHKGKVAGIQDLFGNEFNIQLINLKHNHITTTWEAYLGKPIKPNDFISYDENILQDMQYIHPYEVYATLLTTKFATTTQQRYFYNNKGNILTNVLKNLASKQNITITGISNELIHIKTDVEKVKYEIEQYEDQHKKKYEKTNEVLTDSEEQDFFHSLRVPAAQQAHNMKNVLFPAISKSIADFIEKDYSFTFLTEPKTKYTNNLKKAS